MSFLENVRPFQMAMYGGFGIFMILAVFLLNTADFGSGSRNQSVGPVTIWGTLGEGAMSETLAQIREDTDDFVDVTYEEFRPERFDEALTDAIIEQQQPDLIIIPHRKLVEHRSKILPIDYEFFPRRQLQDTYLDGFEIFARSNGLYAIPYLVDPLILYWNRDTFASNGLARPPETWEDVTGTVVPDLVRRTLDRTVTQSPIALGFYDNNRNASAVLSLLMLQAGSRMVDEQNGEYRVNLSLTSQGGSDNPIASAFRFYTRFANTSDPLYSWNRNKRLDKQEFLSEDLAMYFGMSSEFKDIQLQNPNLNFDVAPVPQSVGARVQRTYGEFYGFAILQSARNIEGAFQVAQTLGNPQYTARVADQFDMAPAHRETIAAGSSSSVGAVLYNAALISRGWLSPQQARTEEAFSQSIRDILAGRQGPVQASQDFEQRLRQAF